jgi:hypothetical protein
LSDYSLTCEPNFVEADFRSLNLDPMDLIVFPAYTVQVRAISSHPIQNYTRQIYLTVSSPPGILIQLDNSVLHTGQSTNLKIMAVADMLNNSDYPVVIRGIGEDGKKRDCTVLVKVHKIHEIY